MSGGKQHKADITISGQRSFKSEVLRKTMNELDAYVNKQGLIRGKNEHEHAAPKGEF